MRTTNPYRLNSKRTITTALLDRKARRTKIALATAYGAGMALLGLTGATEALGQSTLYLYNTAATNAGTWNSSNKDWAQGTTAPQTVQAWVPTDIAVFTSNGSAGTVTLQDTENIGGLTFNGTANTTTISGAGTLNIGANNITITNSTTAGNQDVYVPITGTGNITYNYTATAASVALNLSGTLSGFTGNLIVGPGTSSTALAEAQVDYSMGSSPTPSNVIDVSNYSEISDNNPVTSTSGSTITSLTPTSFTLYNAIDLAYNYTGTGLANAWVAAANGATITVNGVSTPTQKIETYAGVISGNSNVIFGIANSGGRGTVVLGASNTYTGNSYITLTNGNGLLQLGVNNAIPSTSSLTFGPNPAFNTSSSTAVAPLDLHGYNLTLTTLATNTTASAANGSGNIYNTGSTGATITLTGPLTGSAATTFKGDIGDTNVSTAPFNTMAPYWTSAGGTTVNASTNIALNISGGTLILNPASGLGQGNQYTGVTTISGGSLVFGRVSAGQASSNYTLLSSPVVVNNGGTLSSSSAANTSYIGGTGGSITLNTGSTFTPGGTTVGSTGILSTSSLTVNTGAVLDFQVSSLSNFDQVVVAGALTLDAGGTHTIDLIGNAPSAGTYPIIEAGGQITWDGTNGFVMGTPAPNGTSYAAVITGNNVDLVVSAPALRWDPNGNGPPITENGGTWNNGTSTFYNLGTNSETTWNNSGTTPVIIGDDATQLGGTITLGSSIVTGGLLTFGPIYPGYGGYTVTDGGNSALTLTTAAGIDVNSTATLDANIVLAGNQNWSVDNGQVLTVTHSLTQSTPSTLTASGAGTIVLNGSGGSISALQINAGIVALGAIDAVGTAPITINGGSLGFGVSTTYNNTISFGPSGGGIGPYGGANVTLSSNLTSTGNVNIGGSGTLTLTETNSLASLTLTSLTTTTTATLIVSTLAPLGNGATPIKFSGGGLDVSGLATNGITTLPDNLSLAATGNSGLNDVLNFGTGPLTLSGAISGTGDLHIQGSGTLTLSGSSTFSGGALYIDDPITVSVTNPQGLSTGTIVIDQPATLNIGSNVNSGPIRGSQIWTKSGSATLTVSGSSPTDPSAGLGVIIAAGNIQLNSATGLGGNNNLGTSSSAPQGDITVDAGTQLLINTSGNRASSNITLAGGSIVRLATAPTGDFEFAIYSADVGTATTPFVYNFNNNISPTLTVTANSLIDDKTQAVAGVSSDLLIGEPIVVNSGNTLTLESENSVGNYEQAGIILRGTTNNTLDPYATITLQPGATIIATGSGDVDFGGTGRGEPIIGLGTPGSDSLLQLGSHSFLRDEGAATQNQNATDITRLIVDGTGDAGLRIEAPMNAVYTVPNASGALPMRPTDGTTGLFGPNQTATSGNTALYGAVPTGYTNIGNGFTVLSPNRAAGLSNTYTLPSGSVITQAGTLTLAATDPGGATGVINVGPTQPSNVSLALDNTATSGNLIYQIDPTVNASNGATVSNFAGLTVERSNPTAGTVTAQLLGNTTIPSLTISGATVDLVSHDLVVTQGNLATITAQVKSGYNQGNWNGSTGILSSTAAGDTTYLTAVGVLLNDDGHGNPIYGSGTQEGLFDNLNPSVDAVLVKYTYYGDTNLDGAVDGSDYTNIDNGFNNHLTGWQNGDFNYDGVVDGSDYTLIDNAFNTQGPSLGVNRLALIASATAQIAGSSAVPEPTSLALFGIGAIGLIRRRRRHR